jgi:transposase
MEEKRKVWTAKQKLEIVLEGLKEKETVVEVCRRYGISQSMYYEWRNILLEKGGEALKYGGKSKEEAEKDKRIAQLERKVGQLTLECDLLKKLQSQERTIEEKVKQLSEDESCSIALACQIVGVFRSGYYKGR